MFGFFSGGVSKYEVDQTKLSGRNRRSEPRTPQSGRTIALTVGNQTVELYVSDISRGGVGGRCALVLRRGQKVKLAFGNERVVDAKVRWQQGGMVGIQFLRSISPRLLGQLLDGSSRREQRVEADEKISIVTRSGMAHPAILRNVSESGMLIETDVPLMIGQKFKVRTAGGQFSDVKVVWCKEGRVGLAICF